MGRRITSSFVGRTAELSRLEQAVVSAAAGSGAIALVAGEAGIGKTRLVTELCSRLGQPGSTVLSGRCIDLVGAGLPYFPLVEAIRQLRDSPALEELTGDLHELIRFVPELGGSEGARTSREPPDTQLRLYQETVELLDRLSDDHPVVLVLEDLHWADASTLGLISYLAYAVQDRRILVIATYRIDMPREDLSRLVVELGRSGAATSVELAPLSERELVRLLSGASEEAPDHALVTSICVRSEGNPFYAEELLAAAEDDDEASIPHVLRDVLLQRFDQLGGEARATLRLAAASSRDIPYRLLAAVVPFNAEDTQRALREAVEAGLLVGDTAAGTFRFRHALLAEAIYSTLLPGEREAVHARIAQALVADPASAASSIAAEVAHHWAAAGRSAEALRASVTAARDADAMAARPEALRHLERALELWPQVENPQALANLDLEQLLRWSAEVAYYAGAGGRAPELIRRAIALDGASDAVQLGLLYARLATYLLPIGERTAAIAACERAVELVPAEPPSAERAMVLAAYGHALMLAWRLDESRAACGEALAVAAAIGDERPALRARAVLGMSLFLLGFGDDGTTCLHDARQLARENGLVRDELRAQVLLSDVLLMQGRLAEAAKEALQGLAVSRQHGYEGSSGVVLGANAAEAFLLLGDWSRAEDVLETTLGCTGGFRPEGVHMVCAQLELGRGQLGLAREHLELGARAGDEPQSRAAYAAIAAELALWEGRFDDAIELVDQALALGERCDLQIREHKICALGLWAEAERLSDATVRRETATVERSQGHAKELLERARRSAGRAANVASEASGWLAVAEAEHSRVAGMPSPDQWQAGVVAWDELGRPFWAAYCRWRLAEALLASGAPRSEATAPLREAHRMASRLSAALLLNAVEQLARRGRLDLVGSDTRALPDDDNVLGLTTRERQVLQLLARGYTNREIAAELVISVKTASVHVTHILRKLDVDSRIDAARIAQRLAPSAAAP
jgi:DNA-binding CsgD family transcriptional regulator